jgi:hypothetical protein
MISLILAAALATAAPVADQKICHRITYLGSRLNSQKICKTKREWDQIQWEHDHAVRDAQMKNRALNSG